MEPLLSIRGLKTEFITTRGTVRALDGVDLEMEKGEVLGLVGESGCGKSVTALSVMYLIPQPPGRIAGGQVWWGTRNLVAGFEQESELRKTSRGRIHIKTYDSLLKRHRARMNKIRGREISMIFQEPMSSLNPVLPVGYQIAEVLMYQRRREICDSLLSLGDLREEDLETFRRASETADPTSRDHLIAEFSVATGIDAEKVRSVVEAPSLKFDERLEKVRRLARHRTVGSRWFLEYLKALDAVEEDHYRREWQEFSRLSLGQAAADFFDPAKNPDATGLPPLARITPTPRALRLFFREDPPSERLRARVEAMIREKTATPGGMMFANVKEVVINTDGGDGAGTARGPRLRASLDLRFPPADPGLLKSEAEYRSRYLLYRFLMAIPVLRGRLLRPIEAEARRHVLDLLQLVRIPEPTKLYREYPHELSGGMQQRVMIAMALACDPALMIADEPTTALDVTTQAQILSLMRDLRKRVNSAILYITHDLAVIAELCDRVAVMYAGKVAEVAPVDELFTHPLHPYTQGLLESIVSMDSRKVEQGKLLPTIPGTVPDLRNPPPGCRFHPRCKFAFDRCRVEEPRLLAYGPSSKVACHLYDQEGAREAR